MIGVFQLDGLGFTVPAVISAFLVSSSLAEPASSALVPRSKSRGNTKTLFSEIPATHSGINFVNPIDIEHPLKRLYSSAYGGGGVAAGDLDGDGRPDIYFVSGPRENRLYKNLGGGRFEDISGAAGIGGGDAWGGGVAMVDIEGDGDLDLYVCNYESSNQLFVNDGKESFSESARRFGLDIAGAFLMGAFADYDRDGDLDLYLLGHRFYRPSGRPSQNVTVSKDGKIQMLPEFEKYYGVKLRGGKNYQINNVGASDRLLRNEIGPDGHIRFVDVTSEAGISTDPNQGNSVTWWDFNHDGLPDIYVANDFEDPDLLYRNNGNGTFTDVANEQLPHTTWFSMGADCGDINNDGLMDFLVADMAGTTHYKSKTTMGIMSSSKWFMQNAQPAQYMRNCLYVNTGTGKFMEVAFMTGLASTDWTWAVKFGDLDCDGRLDIFFSNGMTRNFNNSDQPLDIAKLVGKTEWDLYENRPPRPEKNLAFHNGGDFAFTNTSAAWGLDRNGMSYAAAYFDLEGDGDLDLVVSNLDEPPSLYRNDCQTGSRIAIQLRGQGQNRFAIGASVHAQTADGIHLRQFNPMRGFSSCDEPIIHIGLGDAKKIEKLTVTWPNGNVSSYEDLLVDRRFVINELDGGAPPSRRVGTRRPMFAKSDALGGARHWEMPFDDFSLQPLLPNRLSRFGPGMACGDIDSDGDEDLFLGGCTGYVGQLLVNDGAGRFEPAALEAAEKHKASEDLGALFFDAEGDGDLDLYVVSGSVEVPPGHRSLIDRLYLNDGKGTFSDAPFASLPGNSESGSVVAAADYDRDGDLDLFVGGRVVPGQYPTTPNSSLLENRSVPDGRVCRFSDVAFKSPKLREAGLVTGALWSDADGDGWIDLFVSTEWGGVRFFQNKEGVLADRTEESGLGVRLGWWTGINGADFDNDGDIDYLATNFGLNTKYKANPKEPELLYYGDVEGRGQNRIIEAGFEHGVCYPHRGFSCSRNAMPFVGTKLKTFHNFASSALAKIYTPERLAGAKRLEANTLESGILVNDGPEPGGLPNFTFRPLPRLAQISPAFGAAVLDANGDGQLDIFLAQNFFGPQIETRPMNDGLGILLQGDGKGGFSPVWPSLSGIVVPEDAKSVVPVDINNDGRPDLVIGVNDGPALAFESQIKSAPLSLRLAGSKRNPTAIGARVTVEFGDGISRVAEVSAGGGYLSQSPPKLYFTGPGGRAAKAVSVRWPDGETSTTKLKAGSRNVLISRDPRAKRKGSASKR